MNLKPILLIVFGVALILVLAGCGGAQTADTTILEAKTTAKSEAGPSPTKEPPKPGPTSPSPRPSRTKSPPTATATTKVGGAPSSPIRVPPTATPSLRAIPTAVPTQVPPTATPTPKAVPTATPTQVPPTPTPTNAPTATPTLTAPNPTPTNTPIPLKSLASTLAPFPGIPLPVGEQVTVTNSYFQVTFYDLYVFYDDFQMRRLGVQVVDLAGQDNDFDIGLTSDIPKGWAADDSSEGESSPIPGEGGVLEVFLPRLTSEQPVEGVFTFKVWVEGETHRSIEFPITLIGYPQVGTASNRQPKNYAMVAGIIRDADTGRPIVDAEVSMWLGPTNRLMPFDMLSVTKGDGSYTRETWDFDLVNAYFAPHTEVPGYVLMVQKSGYQTYVHRDYVRPLSRSETNLDINMIPLNDQIDFDVKWDVPLWSPGVWEIEMNDSWDRFAVAMGKHPDPDDPETWATQLPFIDSNGNILWAKSLPDQSWAVDVSGDGSLVSGTTHATRADNFIYVWDQDGNELWRAPLDSESLDVDISTSNQYVATGKPGPSYSLGLYDARTGVKAREFDTGWNKIRQVDFAPDGQHIVTGPMLHMLTLGGETIWRRYEFSGLPYAIWISSDQSRIMIPDKGDYISMYNWDGDLLWRGMLNVLTYGAMSSDGSLVVALSHGGYLHCYSGEGELLWYRRISIGDSAGGAGHNGVDITSDGKYIAVGGGNYTTLLYDAHGNLLWRHQGDAPIDGSEHPYKHSVMAVRISPDGTKIVSGYGTSDPRLIYFERKPGQ